MEAGNVDGEGGRSYIGNLHIQLCCLPKCALKKSINDLGFEFIELHGLEA